MIDPTEEEVEAPQEEGGDFSEEALDDSTREVASSMVAAWGYNRAAEKIEVSFQNGHQASYDCTPEQWEAAKEAVSPGKFVHENFL